jgi:tRNA A37 threonylcarbamoyladenosine modification protein TsaB
MLTFAIDTSSIFLSIAVFEDNDCIYSLLFKPLTLSKTIIGLIDKTLKTLNIKDFTYFERYFITVGPGKYISLRVGIATLKGLLYGEKKTILNVNTLDLLATNIIYIKDVISVISSSFPYTHYGIYHTLNRIEMGKIELENLKEKIKPDAIVLCPEMHKIQEFLPEESIIYKDNLINVPQANNMLKVEKYAKETSVEEIVPVYDVTDKTI